MARTSSRRVIVDARIVLDEPLLIAGRADIEVDVIPFVDGQGRCVIPATSLAGAMRAALEDSSGEHNTLEVDRIFGDAGERGASRLSICDVVLEDVTTEIRHGVGIDRETGAAAASIKFDRLVVAPGAHGHLRMTCDLREDEASADPSPELHALLGILASPGLRLGSGTTRGLGKIRFTEITAASFDVKTPRGILDLAESAASQGHGAALGEAFTIAEIDDRELSTPCIQIDWKPILPLLVGDGLPGDAVDHWPFVVARRAPGGQEAAPRAVAVLPGSSIKGALRSRAEWVIRTIAGPQLQGDERFQDQIDVPVVDSLFGVVAGRRLGYRRGALRFSDCTADLISSKDAKPVSWESWEKVRFEQSTKADRERHLVTSLENLGLSHLVPRSHIAIDRWTGSVAGSRLFSEIEPWCLKWSPIKIELDPRMVPRSESERLAGAALLLLVLDELVAGTITFGSRATRGYGSVHVDAEAIDYSGIAELCPDLRDLDLRNGLRSLPDEVRSTLSEALCAVVDAAVLEEVQR